MHGRRPAPARSARRSTSRSTIEPDVVIVDPRLPEVDGGIAFITRSAAQLPGVRILAMSWSDSLESAALDSGADGFVRKTFRPTELVAAIVAAGRRDRPPPETCAQRRSLC